MKAKLKVERKTLITQRNDQTLYNSIEARVYIGSLDDISLN